VIFGGILGIRGIKRQYLPKPASTITSMMPRDPIAIDSGEHQRTATTSAARSATGSAAPSSEARVVEGISYYVRSAGGTRGGSMAEVAEGFMAVEQDRPPEPARVLGYEEQLQIAKHVVQAMSAAGIDCELAEAASAH